MRKLILLILGISSVCYGQNARKDGIVQSRSGAPAPGALIDVCTQPATNVVNGAGQIIGCTTHASLCSSLTDIGCTQPNPVIADGLGNYHFYAVVGTYTLVFHGSGLTSSVLPDQGIGTGSGGGGGGTAVLPIAGNYSGTVTSLAGQSTVGATVVNALPVIQHSHDGGAGQTLAYLNSDSSGTSTYATVFDHTPAQCTGYANGIAANGDAQCNNTNIFSMPGTTGAVSAAGNGNCYFDSANNYVFTCSVNGNAAVALASTYANLTNTDLLGANQANSLEQSATTNNQSYRLFKNRTSNSNYAFLQSYFDTPSGDFVIGASWDGTNELTKGIGFASGTGATPTLRWEISPSTYNFRPIAAASNTESLGGPSSLIDGLYLGDQNATSGLAAVFSAVNNDSGTGTTVNKMAKLTATSPATAVITAITDTQGTLGCVGAGAGTTLKASIARAGIIKCIFDGATTVGDWVQPSTAVIGNVHDAGATPPGIGQILGRVLSTNGGGGTYALLVGMQENPSSVYNHSGTQQQLPHTVIDTCTLGTSCAVTLTGTAVYTNSTSYVCVAQDQTAAAATKIVQASGSAFTITGTGTDVLNYSCIGN